MSLKSTNFHQENMQHHTTSTSFGLFLNLNISGTPHLSKLTFWTSTNNTNHNFNSLHLKHDNFSGAREKNNIKVIFPNFISYWHSKYVKKVNHTAFKEIPLQIKIYWLINGAIICCESWLNKSIREVIQIAVISIISTSANSSTSCGLF